MSALMPCPACNRHVFLDACACPFCSAKLRVCEAPRAAAPNAHLSRAARLAAGAALVGVAACGSTIRAPYGAPPPYDASVDAAADGADAADSADSAAPAAPDGPGGAGGTIGKVDALPPVDALPRVDAPPSDAASDRSVMPIYGAAAPVPGKPVG